MAKATSCKLQNRLIDIAEALELRDAAHQRHESTPDSDVVSAVNQ